jgi:hypothetical protein
MKQKMELNKEEKRERILLQQKEWRKSKVKERLF